MFKPTDRLQACVGTSIVLVSIGVCISLITGSVVDFSVAGAKLSVNRKLERVEKITEALEQSTEQLKQEPSVSKVKLEVIEQDIRRIDRAIEQEEKAIADELDRFIENDI